MKKLRREMLPKEVHPNGMDAPVVYRGGIRRIVDVHYGDDGLVYLKDNGGEPVRICELKIKKTWVKILEAHKRYQEHLLGVKEITKTKKLLSLLGEIRRGNSVTI